MARARAAIPWRFIEMGSKVAATFDEIAARPVTYVYGLPKSAEKAVSALAKGARLFGMTRGTFTLLDLVRAILRKTGPADVVISTWTAGIRDAGMARWLQKSGRIRSLVFLVDRSFASRQPEYCRVLRRRFGDECVSTTRTHAKFAVIYNDEWSVVVRSSMNLNKNTRFEQFDIDESVPMREFIMAHVDEMRAIAPRGWFGDYADATRAVEKARKP